MFENEICNENNNIEYNLKQLNIEIYNSEFWFKFNTYDDNYNSQYIYL